MTQQEFDKQMQRLISQFGSNVYSPERELLIAQELKPFDAAVWEKMVDRFLGESRQAPLLPEIRELLSREKERLWLAKKTSIETPIPSEESNCTYCFGDGIVWAKKKDAPNASDYVFICSCSHGRKDRRAFPRWQESLSSAYERI